MADIKNFSRYAFDGTRVLMKPRMYPIAPALHKIKKHERFFLTDDAGTTRFVDINDIRRLVVEVPKSAGRGKTVLHRSTGKKFGSMKSACEAFGISVQTLKSSSDFEIK